MDTTQPLTQKRSILVRIGWGLIGLSTIIALLGDWIPSESAIILAFTFIILIFLAGGQLILMWHYRQTIRRPLTLFILFTIIASGVFLNTRYISITQSTWVIRNLYLIVILWTATLLFTIGWAFAIYLFQHDHAMPWIAAMLISYTWYLAIIFKRGGANLLLKKVISNEMSAVFSTMNCMLLWLIPLGTLSFLYHSIQLFLQEFRNKEIK